MPSSGGRVLIRTRRRGRIHGAEALQTQTKMIEVGTVVFFGAPATLCLPCFASFGRPPRTPPPAIANEPGAPPRPAAKTLSSATDRNDEEVLYSMAVPPNCRVEDVRHDLISMSFFLADALTASRRPTRRKWALSHLKGATRPHRSITDFALWPRAYPRGLLS